jgi:hypothetical protein
MVRNNPITRRDFLRMAGLGTLGVLGSGTIGSLLSACSAAAAPVLDTNGMPMRDPSWEPDVETPAEGHAGRSPDLPGQAHGGLDLSGRTLERESG